MKMLVLVWIYNSELQSNKLLLKSTMSKTKPSHKPKTDRYVDMSKQDDFLFNRTPILASALQKLKQSQKGSSKQKKLQNLTAKHKILDIPDEEIEQISAPKKKIKKSPETEGNLPNFAYLPLQKDLYSFYTINKSSLKSMESVPEPKFEIGSLVLTAICDRGIGGKFLVANFFRNKKGYIDYKEISQVKSKDNNFDAIQAYSEPGQFVIGSVVKSMSPNHIQLSLKQFPDIDPKFIRLNQVIPAQIKSKQEMGCHLLVSNCSTYKFFLPKTAVSEQIYESLSEKKQIITYVSEIDHAKHLVKVNMVSTEMSDEQEQSLENTINLRGIEEEELTKYQLEQYVSPGNLVHTKIIKILSNGVMVKFLKIFIGFIHADHLKNTLSAYKVDDKMVNRIIYACSNPPLIYLSERHNSLYVYEPRCDLYSGVNKPKDLQQIQKSYLSKREQFYIHPTQLHSQIDNIGKFWSKQNNYFERYQIMTTRKVGLRVGEIAKDIPFNNFKVYSSANTNKSQKQTSKKFKVMCLDVWNKVVKISYDEKIMKSNKMLFSVEEMDLDDQEEANKQYCGFVKSVNDNGVIVEFCNNVRGTIPKSEVKMSGLEIDESWKGKGIQVYIANIKEKNGFITLSVLPPSMRKKPKSEKSHEKNKDKNEESQFGTIVSIVHNSINPIYIKLREKVVIKISIFKGIKPASLNNLSVIQNLSENFEVGQKVRVFRKGKQYFLYPPEQLSDKDLRICRVVSFKGSFVRLQTGKNQFHSCHICDVSDLIIPFPFSTLQTRQYYIGRVLPSSLICLRNSIVLNGIPKSILDCKQKYGADQNRGDYRNRILTVGSNGLKEDMVIFGYVKTFSDKGCFVSVSNDYEVRVELSELSDQPIKGDKSKFYPANRLILCRLISQKVKANDPTKHLFDASARESVVKLGYPLNDDLLQVGLTVSGYVTGYSKGKALIRLSGSKFTGIIHPNEIPGINKEEPIEKSIKIGTHFKENLKIIEVNNDGRRLIRLSGQPKYFNKYKDIQVNITPDQRVANLFASYQQMLKETAPEPIEHEMEVEQENSDDQYNRIQGLLANQIEEEEQGVDENQMELENGEEVGQAENGEMKEQDDEEEDDDDEEQEEEVEDNENEQNGDIDEENKARMLAQFSDLPHNEQTYQSLILANNTPQSHIKYISSMINTASPQKIREQFVRSISQLEQIKDKQNVWIAWLNMQTILGKFEDTVKKAIQAEVGIPVYNRILQILREQGKWELATEIGKKMLKKNNRDPKSYISMLRHYLLVSKNLHEDEKPHYKEIIRRAKQCLKSTQINMIQSQYAKVLYEEKQAEKARTIFGDLLQSNPKRTDLWSMFVDLEIKHGSIDKAREILERSLTVPLKKKKLITILKKYYQIEEVHGTPESAAKILQRAKALADQYAENEEESEEEDQ